MVRIRRVFGIGRERLRLENPRSSIGEQIEIFTNKKGTFTCWEAIGPVREDWDKLRPEIKGYIESIRESGPVFTLEIFMIGRSEDTAAAKVLICSSDPISRKEYRKAVKGSKILDSYPGFGLGDSPCPPGAGSAFVGSLAQEDIASGSLKASSFDDDGVVEATWSDNAFGRRLYIRTRKGGRRPATAGPILHINGKVYQLTVGHAFLEFENSDPFAATYASLDDCDFDGQSDSDEDDSGASAVVLDKGKSKEAHDPSQHDVHKSEANDAGEGMQGSDFPPQNSLSAVTDHMLLPSSAKDPERSIAVTNSIARKRKPKIPRRLERLGKLAMISETGPRQALDYALIELEGKYRDGINEVPCGPNNTQRWLRVIKPGNIGFADVVNIITMTASLGFVRGKLYATACYIRLPNQRVLQEVYKVRLNEELADGDCGSAVIDPLDGHLYGHIVAGVAGTGLAYIVPAMKVFKDIVESMGGDVAFIPPIPSSPSGRFSKDRTKLEPLHIREFASRQYYNQFSDLKWSREDRWYKKLTSGLYNTGDRWVRSTGTGIRGIKSKGRTNAVIRLPKRQDRPPMLRYPRATNHVPFKTRTHQPNSPESNVATNRTDEETRLRNGPGPFVTSLRNYREESDALCCLGFKERFFALPGDLQACIIANLSVPDILHLRLVNKRWHKMMLLNQGPIARAFLEHNPVPRFAISLYPLPHRSEIDLRYICGLWHRLLVASKLSAVIANWMKDEHFVINTKQKSLDFEPLQARMRRRLLPILFTILHFLDSYREAHLKRLFGTTQKPLSDFSVSNSIESQIMSMYDGDTLLQVHQVFPSLTSYFSRQMRPPSHLGTVERSLRGYTREEAPSHILVAVLCLGGLKEVLRLSEIEKYDARRRAVDDWYASMAQKTVNSSSRSHRQDISLSRWHSGEVSVSTESNSDNTASSHSSIFSSIVVGNNHDGWRRSNSFGSADTGISAGPPVSKMTATQTRLLFSGLPTLEQLWITTAENLLLENEVVARATDIKRKAEVSHELVREEITDADELIFGQAVQDIPGEEALVWGSLVQEVRGRSGDDEGLPRWYHGPHIL